MADTFSKILTATFDDCMRLSSNDNAVAVHANREMQREVFALRLSNSSSCLNTCSVEQKTEQFQEWSVECMQACDAADLQ